MFRRTRVVLVGFGLVASLSPAVVAQEAQPAGGAPAATTPETAAIIPETSVRTPLGVGEVTANSVYVRSGPSLNHYTICKLKSGDKITVIAEKGDWLEILPPPGVFSLISGDFVDTSDDKAGTVNADNVRIRAGSLLNDDKYTVQTLLKKGAAVQILGRNPDGFVRIEPPPAASVWINRNYVAFGNAPATGEPTADAKPTALDTAVANKPSSAADFPKPSAPASPPPTTTLASPVTAAKSNDGMPVLAALDAEARAELAKPISERNLAPILDRYKNAARQATDEAARRYAEIRVEQIGTMIQAAGAVQGISHFNAEAEAKRREFMEGRIKIRETLPPIPSALDIQGELRPSALFPPGGSLRRYRLVDPSAPQEKTIGYVEIPAESSIDVTNFMGRYVGVRATAKRLQSGGVDPVPIFVAGELVLLNPAGSESGAVDE